MRGFGPRDKVVVITGNGGALGSAFARGFADHGASLAILDFNLDKAKTTAASTGVDLPVEDGRLAAR
jgi:NAD(P)-dependent dehydrogenase (short-subunit alcohol dehydrogenase family)